VQTARGAAPGSNTIRDLGEPEQEIGKAERILGRGGRSSSRSTWSKATIPTQARAKGSSGEAETRPETRKRSRLNGEGARSLSWGSSLRDRGKVR
jgi:hypothetical protein